MMDCDRKIEDGVSSEPAFDVSQVCMRVSGCFNPTDEFFAVFQIDRGPVSYTHLRAHETLMNLVCRLLLEKKK